MVVHWVCQTREVPCHPLTMRIESYRKRGSLLFSLRRSRMPFIQHQGNCHGYRSVATIPGIGRNLQRAGRYGVNRLGLMKWWVVRKLNNNEEIRRQNYDLAWQESVLYLNHSLPATTGKKKSKLIDVPLLKEESFFVFCFLIFSILWSAAFCFFFVY